MDARGVLNAMISFYMEQGRKNRVYDTGQWDMLVHMVIIVREMNPGEAAEWLSEECQERLIAMGD